MELLTIATGLLRDPVALIDGPDERGTLARLAPSLLAITVLGAAVFGVVVGSYRGGVQVVYAAIKMPALLLLPVVVSLPAVRALLQAGGLQVSYSRVALACLAGAARTAILTAALGPVVWLYYSITPDYHASVLVMALALGLAGLPGMATVSRAVIPADDGSSVAGRSRLRWLSAVGILLVMGLTGAQSGWLLRPFVARPTAEIAFLRPIEEDVFSSLAATSRSARGDYRGWEAEAEGLLSKEAP